MRAQDFDYSSATVVFMFDPFGVSTLRSVLTMIGQQASDKRIRFAYANPTHLGAFEEQDWLQRTDYWEKHNTGLEHSVAFYSSSD